MKSFIITAIITIASIGQLTLAQNIVNINENDFINQVWDYKNSPEQFTYKGDKPCIIDFYADWCGPCRILGKNLATVADRYKEQIIIYKIDIDNPQNAGLASFFGIRSIPYILFIDTQEINSHTGSLSVEQLDEIITTRLLNASK